MSSPGDESWIHTDHLGHRRGPSQHSQQPCGWGPHGTFLSPHSPSKVSKAWGWCHQERPAGCPGGHRRPHCARGCWWDEGLPAWPRPPTCLGLTKLAPGVFPDHSPVGWRRPGALPAVAFPPIAPSAHGDPHRTHPGLWPGAHRTSPPSPARWAVFAESLGNLKSSSAPSLPHAAPCLGPVGCSSRCTLRD